MNLCWWGEKSLLLWKAELLSAVLMVFSAMPSWIVVPNLLFQSGMDFAGSYAACLGVSAVGTLFWGKLMRCPVIVAPSIAMLTWLVYGEIISKGHSWQMVLGAVCIASVLGLVGILSPLGRYVSLSIPEVLRNAFPAGLGLVLVFQGFLQGKIFVGVPFTLITLGSLASPVMYLTLLGVLIILILVLNRSSFAFAIGLFSVALISLLQGFWVIPAMPFMLPEGFDKVVFQLDLGQAALHPELILTIFLIMFSEGQCIIQALLCDAQSKAWIKQLAVLFGVNMVSSFLGSMSLRPAPETFVGRLSVNSTNRAAYVAAIVMLLLIFCEPVVKEISSFGAITASVLICSGLLVLCNSKELFHGDLSDRLTVLCFLLFLPFSHDFVIGLGMAIIVHVVLKCFSGQKACVPFCEMILAGMYGLFFFSQGL